jgi:cyclohexanone monooxygenase
MTGNRAGREAARARYRAERNKRITGDRGEIPELVGDLARYLDDPYTTAAPREPVRDEVDAAVVGAGLGGLLAAARLREAGVERIRLVDVAGDVGGVWYWNRYPGCMCDIESYIYLPLLEEVGYVPTRKYAWAAEIAGHAQAIAKHYDLYPDALFHTKVTAAVWSPAARRWTVDTDRGDEISARFIVLTNGNFSLPKLPAIPGIRTFAGRSFHTSRWDYGYTGGDAHSDLTGLRDKVVGVIGTGATGIQCVPPLGRSARRVFVFQRTPSTIAVRANADTDPAWAASLRPGWQRERMENFTRILNGAPVSEDLVADGWTDLYTDLVVNPDFARLAPEERPAAMERADFERMESIRARISETVHDPATAEAMKPWYRYMCKRPLFHDEYLPAFNRPNVTLVDTDGRGIERIVPEGVVVDGRLYELDCLIYATGFEMSTAYTHRTGFEVTGRDGVTLTRKWAGGLSTLHGLTSRNFPNMFVFPGLDSQGTVVSNFVHTLSENAAHTAYIVRRVGELGASGFEVSASAEAEWVRTILERRIDRTAFFAECTPGWLNAEGHLDERPKQNANFGGGPIEFFELLRAWRADGTLPGLELI